MSVPERVESRLVAGGISSAVNFAATVAITLIQVPVFLSVWSPEEYGLWLVVLATSGLIVSIDLGHADFVGQRITLAGVSDTASVRRLLGSAIRAAMFVGALELVVAACLAFTPLRQLGPVAAVVDPAAQREVSLALVILTTYYVVFGSVGALLVRLYASHGMYARSVWIGTAQRCAQFLGVMSAVLCGSSLVVTVITQVLIGAMFSSYVYIDIRRRFPALWPWIGDGSVTTGLRNLGSSVFVTVAAMLDQAGNSIMLVFSGRLPGSTATSSFGTTRTVGNTIMQASAVLLHPVVPEIGRYVSRQESRKLEDTISTASLLSTLPISIGSIVVAPLLAAGYELWTRGMIPIDRPLLATIIAAVLVRQWCSPVLLCLLGMNAVRSVASASAARVATMIAASVMALTIAPAVRTLGFCVLLAEIVGGALAVVAATRLLRDIGARIPIRMLALSGAQASVAGLCVVVCTLEVAPALLVVPACLTASAALTAWQVRVAPPEVIHRIVRVFADWLFQRARASGFE